MIIRIIVVICLYWVIFWLVKLGLFGLIKLIIIKVEEELSVEFILERMVEINFVNINLISFIGNIFVIKNGNMVLLFGILG